MADSVDIIINDSEWTNISGTKTNGFFTNQGVFHLFYRESASTPDPSVLIGHVLYPKDEMNFTLKTGQEVYARSLKGDGLVVVTLD
jgi:hypothetical protein